MVNLRAVRKAAGLTQEELADMCGKRRETICAIERGVNNPSVSLAKRLGEILGVPWVDFFED